VPYGRQAIYRCATCYGLSPECRPPTLTCTCSVPCRQAYPVRYAVDGALPQPIPCPRPTCLGRASVSYIVDDGEMAPAYELYRPDRAERRRLPSDLARFVAREGLLIRTLNAQGAPAVSNSTSQQVQRAIQKLAKKTGMTPYTASRLLEAAARAAQQEAKP